MAPQHGSSAADPISLVDDGPNLMDYIDLEEYYPGGLGEVLVIDSDSDDEVQIITPVVSKKRPVVKLRNQPPQHPWCHIDSFFFEKRNDLGPTGSRIKIGDTVEFWRVKAKDEDADDVFPNDFLRVFHILENISTGEVRLRGLLFRRHKFIAPLLNMKLNEVFLQTRIYSARIDKRPYMEQGLHEISAAQFLRKRRLNVTNRPFPDLSWRDERYLNRRTTDKATYDKCKQEILEGEVLCCRKILIQTYDQEMDKKSAQKQCQSELRSLTFEEADNGKELLKGPGRAAPSVDALRKSTPSDDPPTATSPLKRKRNNQTKLPYDEGTTPHTFGDIFCGAGGASCGAKMAGLMVKFGVDIDEPACATFRENFPSAKIYTRLAQDFAITPPKDVLKQQVDILHMSPPCQYFSGAHTTPGKNDDANSAAIFTVGALVGSLRPRIATLEETSGITHDRHYEWFYSMLHGVSEEGYSLRWSVLRCMGYGCTQPRPRLFLIAAAPGVPLPHFPDFTHGPPGPESAELGLQPFTTLRRAAGNIPPEATLNDAEAPGLEFPENKCVVDPDLPSKRTLLTNNDHAVYHWEGKRKYTIRELACLQSFPWDYRFVGSRAIMKRQIGNAVPPVVFEKIIAECREVLKSLDNRSTRPRHDSPIADPIDVEYIDDDIGIVQPVEQAQEQEMRLPTFPPAVPMRAISRGMEPRDTSVPIGRDEDDILIVGERSVKPEGYERETELILTDQGTFSDDESDAPVPKSFPIDDPNVPVPRTFSIASSTPPADDGRSVTLDHESRPPSPYPASTSPAGVGSEWVYVEVGDDQVSGGASPMSPAGVQATDATTLSRATSASPIPDPMVAVRGSMRRMGLHGEAEGEGEGEVSRRGSPGVARHRKRSITVIVIDDD